MVILISSLSSSRELIEIANDCCVSECPTYDLAKMSIKNKLLLFKNDGYKNPIMDLSKGN